ncbi:hypothetical protein O6H91_01G169200 [Diphasiastrum complanatum]|uniref:Uncharacterized protein n=1 Tax=Diphasiastrum complanatum TaxID=34168 RepID=A0ACC2EYU8_DIPCM|nr:hypothetical protein O6H91_01G169200 [Diphasiastrum complanatum]
MTESMDLAYNMRNSGMHLAACAAVPVIFLCLFNTASPAVDTMPGMNMQAPIGSIFNSTSDDAIHSKDANRSARHTSGHYVCSGKDIRISQHYLGFSADEIPEFALEIVNTCRSKKTSGRIMFMFIAANSHHTSWWIPKFSVAAVPTIASS